MRYIATQSVRRAVKLLKVHTGGSRAALHHRTRRRVVPQLYITAYGTAEHLVGLSLTSDNELLYASSFSAFS